MTCRKGNGTNKPHTWYISHCDITGHGLCTFCQIRWDRQ